MDQKLVRYATKKYDAPSLDKFKTSQMYTLKPANNNINKATKNFVQGYILWDALLWYSVYLLLNGLNDDRFNQMWNSAELQLLVPHCLYPVKSAVVNKYPFYVAFIQRCTLSLSLLYLISISYG